MPSSEHNAGERVSGSTDKRRRETDTPARRGASARPQGTATRGGRQFAGPANRRIRAEVDAGTMKAARTTRTAASADATLPTAAQPTDNIDSQADASRTMRECARLESRLSAIAEWCRLLQRENRALRDAQSQLMAERARLIEKNELARNKVEQMIARLKAMENG